MFTKLYFIFLKKKLQGNPFLLISSAGFDYAEAISHSPRFRFWTTQLNALCKTMHVPSSFEDTESTTGSLQDTLDVAILSLKNKVTEVSSFNICCHYKYTNMHVYMRDYQFSQPYHLRTKFFFYLSANSFLYLFIYCQFESS